MSAFLTPNKTTAGFVLILSILVNGSGARTTSLQGNSDFFDKARRSINHDQNVLKRLKSHPLASASGWNIDERQDGDKGWTETAAPKPRAPRLGGAKWERENDRLERELQRMSDSVNVMFKDQKWKRAYRRDEDRLFKEAVTALKTADELYPDSPGEQASDQALIDGALAQAGGGAGGGRAAAEARILSAESPSERRAAKEEWARKHASMDTAVKLYKAGGDAALERAVVHGPDGR
eukprot:CAMPEP_0172181986 /NCGR_PEP_ID=MMETSP1050-20130122/18139_1 /TAXON_ID=233186 /ORGANISM="Cryptomonas curvata, Strain CCAP979/52" /LENGTH=235 /DNA_ID=CAMNT_0012855363 /DNA_START=191 /DNA_END=894 /DNA_ORIENTATION=-